MALHARAAHATTPYVRVGGREITPPGPVRIVQLPFPSFPIFLSLFGPPGEPVNLRLASAAKLRRWSRCGSTLHPRGTSMRCKCQYITTYIQVHMNKSICKRRNDKRHDRPTGDSALPAIDNPDPGWSLGGGRYILVQACPLLLLSQPQGC